MTLAFLLTLGIAHLELDLTGEAYVGTTGHTGYRTNADLYLTVAPWDGGQLFVYGEAGYGPGISNKDNIDITLSNLEAPNFVQLSEVWFEQKLADDHLRFKVGRQDVNRDLGQPRFPGNFINNTYGALPTVPMPSFPTPGWGALACGSLGPFELRAAVTQDNPQVESLAIHSDEGLFEMVSLFFTHAVGESAPPAGGMHQIGFWHSAAGTGFFGVLDIQLLLPDKRSVQTFVRAAYSADTGSYVGGGATYHGLWGRNDTVGLGGGWQHDGGGDGFAEAFYKARFWPGTILSVEPDVMVYSTGTVYFTLRSRIKW
jgi:carbohydrate-selective porin (OprB family)